MLVLAATAFVAFNMYLDRACLAQVKDLAGRDLALNADEQSWLLSAFFWSYALAQVPAALIAKRFGLRLTLAVCCLLWSAMTVATGMANSFVTILCARLLVGLAEAAAYPTASAVIRNWFPVESRGRANAVVTFGGRAGLVLALFATPWLVGQLGSWRLALSAYGLLGIVAAVIYFVIVRDRPGDGPREEAKAEPFPFAALVRSPNVWLASAHQFGVNLGWAFLITQMPSYFTARYDVPVEERAWVSTLPVFVGCFGMLAGGVLIDGLTKRYGLRIGRIGPLSGWLAVAALAYVMTSQAPTAWTAAGCLGLMAFAVDAANPAYWAFSQDIGQRHAAATLGFGNMIGNIGAALSPVILGTIQVNYGWPAVFWAGAAAFGTSAVVALFLNPYRAAFDSGPPLPSGVRGEG